MIDKEKELEELLRKGIGDDRKDSRTDNARITDHSGVESVLIFKLLLSLNQGNTGMFHGRIEMAEKQLDKLKEEGYNLEEIYKSI